MSEVGQRLEIGSVLTDWDYKGCERVPPHDSSVVHDVLGLDLAEREEVRQNENGC